MAKYGECSLQCRNDAADRWRAIGSSSRSCWGSDGSGLIIALFTMFALLAVHFLALDIRRWWSEVAGTAGERQRRRTSEGFCLQSILRMRDDGHDREVDRPVPKVDGSGEWWWLFGSVQRKCT